MRKFLLPALMATIGLSVAGLAAADNVSIPQPPRFHDNVSIPQPPRFHDNVSIPQPPR